MKKIIMAALFLGLVLIAGCVQRETGVLQGHVRIGPLCPVEPCRISPDQMEKVYDLRKILIYDENRQSLLEEVQIDKNGSYMVNLAPGNYVVDINRIGIDRSAQVPGKINIESGKTVVLDISIDTGIR
ncbi:MAG: hypothetical protein WCE94_09070 [Candidatus Methanoperedens sp.]